MAKRKVTPRKKPRRTKPKPRKAKKTPDVAKKVKQSQQRLAVLVEQLGAISGNGDSKSLLDSEISSVDAAALLGHKQRNWVRANVPKLESGKFDPRIVVATWVEEIQSRAAPSELDEITRRRKLAETQNIEELLRINRLRAARLEGRLMPVDWVHRWLKEAAAELRKPIEIIGRNHPEYKQLILNGLDNASDKVSEMLAAKEVLD